MRVRRGIPEWESGQVLALSITMASSCLVFVMLLTLWVKRYLALPRRNIWDCIAIASGFGIIPYIMTLVAIVNLEISISLSGALCVLFAWWLGAAIFLRITFSCRRRRNRTHVIGIFHPFCDQRAGGERVLWAMLAALLQDERFGPGCATQFHIYTDSASSPHAYRILAQAERTFGIRLASGSLGAAAASRIRFVFLRRCDLTEPARYPRLTMLLQSLGSLVPALEALCHGAPDVMLDSAGYPFTYPLFSLVGGCTVMAYTHYPTISKDMVQVVASRTEQFNNRVARSPLLSQLKLRYYQAFALAYRQCGRFVHLLMVNSSWTRDQMQNMWRPKQGVMHTVFPPCPTDEIARLPLWPRQPVVLSVGQFRPEKNHNLQLDAFKLVLSQYTGPLAPVLLLVGTERPVDAARIRALRGRIAHEGLEGRVVFSGEQTREELVSLLGSSLIGLHTMRDEHFGIGVVELMAAGLITVSHRSAGPMLDIIVPATGPKRCGYLATTAQEYADAITEILSLAASYGDADSVQSPSPHVATSHSHVDSHATEFGLARRKGDQPQTQYPAQVSCHGPPVPLTAVQQNARARSTMFSPQAFTASLAQCLVPALLGSLTRVLIKPQEFERSMADLPPEAMLRVASLLSEQDRAYASRVCASWRCVPMAVKRKREEELVDPTARKRSRPSTVFLDILSEDILSEVELPCAPTKVTKPEHSLRTAVCPRCKVALVPRSVSSTQVAFFCSNLREGCLFPLDECIADFTIARDSVHPALFLSAAATSEPSKNPAKKPGKRASAAVRALPLVAASVGTQAVLVTIPDDARTLLKTAPARSTGTPAGSAIAGPASPPHPPPIVPSRRRAQPPWIKPAPVPEPLARAVLLPAVPAGSLTHATGVGHVSAGSALVTDSEDAMHLAKQIELALSDGFDFDEDEPPETAASDADEMQHIDAGGERDDFEDIATWV